MMKRKLGGILQPLIVCIAAVSVILIGITYFNFISKKIYEDSTNHLEEIYDQVKRSFIAFAERNWGLLESWGDYFILAGNEGSDSISAIIEKERENWGFTEFYFFSNDKTGMTASGIKYEYDTHNAWSLMTESKEPIIIGRHLSNGTEVTVFARPVPHGKYKDFEYDSIAVSYSNADMSRSINVDAFSGKAKCFVVHNDGTILLSAQPDKSTFENYLEHLRSVSDIPEEEFSKIQSDWQSGSTGLVQCNIENENNCILYQPLGYQDYILLSIVPQNVLSAGFLSVQKTTINVLIAIFTLIGAAALILIVQNSLKKSRESETELRYRELMFDVLSNSVDDIFIMLDETNISVDYISPNIERLLGIPVQEARSNIRVMEKCAVNFDVVIPRNVLDEIPLNGNKYRECEYMHQNTGERRWYKMTVYRMHIQEKGKYIIVLSDRTQDRQRNTQLREALNAARSANEAKSNFLSNMSHDIRTPMNAIVGFSVLLEKDADKPDKVREYTRKITASGHHLLSLINDVLDMSKIESGKTSLNAERFSLPELIEELNIIITPQAKAKEQEFKIYVQGAPPEQLMGDKLRLNQILINLLSNAVKYTPHGGKIEFTVSELPSSKQYAKLRFIVKDNGIGMSKEFQEHIFSPFSREINSVINNIQGTGLGMAITKNLVDLMGGIISVESAPDEGSTFTAELSFALPEKEESDSWFKQKILRMLVADDEEEICLDIRELMRDTGVEVAYVTDGSAAAAEAVRAHEQGEDYDVILLDWKMPGVSGVDAAKMIRGKIGQDIPILVLTSYDWNDIESEAREAGINAFMSKPFFVSTFWQTIKPMFNADVPAVQEENTVQSSVMKDKFFLVAEDNELNAEILTEMLHMEGADCEIAVNGKEAVEKFTASGPGKFDMIFMDVQMPVMNGYEATKLIRASAHPEAKTIPIAAMTANTFAEDVRNAINSGMNGHLAKPIDMNAVRELADKLLNKKES